MTVHVDEKYYEVAKPTSVAEGLLVAARDRMFEDFLARMAPTPQSKIIDVGVSDVISDGANVLERKYRYQRNITACGIGEGGDFQRAYPEVAYQQINANERLPFAENSFDIATANAVLEHVGSDDYQRFFIRELLRVSDRVFITVPNRFFPIEHHTAVPLLHYTDRSFKVACQAINKTSWLAPSNLILMTRKKLWRLSEGLDCNIAVGYTGLKLGPFSSNLFLSLRR